ncbi:hypothetical protein [Paludisphaera mucosa]|uniref:Uncharacterized protein n=1 Tax=Paludisphaera mucosa TaxID=3030827 RepID=A0ABT6FGG8_9BACT|nr:hypothetical protein [Paludisphaera mucosa]MDG3006667.1 hypothetical protein [Paludisphaera mucosa]
MRPGRAEGGRRRMRIAIIGDGEAERAWADWARRQADLSLAAVVADGESALALPGLDAVIVGGPAPGRGEALQRLAAAGLAIVALHPPGPDAEPYERASVTGSTIVPDLPLRLHPGVDRLRTAIADGSLGDFRVIRHVIPTVTGQDLVRTTFASSVDALRTLLGEFESLTAAGDPEGPAPVHELVVRLRDEGGRPAEMRVSSELDDLGRLTVVGADGSLALEYDPQFQGPARLVRRIGAGPPEVVETFEGWDPRAAIFEALRSDAATARPTLLDGLRAMELGEAVRQSLIRGRTIGVHPRPTGAEAGFKSRMTAVGCLLLIGVVALFATAAAGRALGFESAVYLTYLIPPALIGFLALQLLGRGVGTGPIER